MEWIRGEYCISTDKPRLSIEAIHRFLSQSYWAETRPAAVIEKSIQHSICFGLYRGAEQIGFSRVVTDYATFYWLCDVFIDEAYRGQALGKWLVACVVSTPELRGLRGFLATRDAHGLYEQFGFEVPADPRRHMVRPADAAVVDPEEMRT